MHRLRPAPVSRMSPTITTPAMTQLGLILGTAAYMSPEQARGKSVDRRADIWAFGCVLFEMLSGRRAFDAEDVSLTLARVLEREVDFTPMPPEIPARVPAGRRAVPAERRQATHQRHPRCASGVGRGARYDVGISSRATVPASARLRLGALAIVAALALVAAAALAFVHFREAPAERRSVSFQFSAPEKSVIASFDLSPDGRYVAFVTRGESSKLWVRPIESLDAQELPGTDGARSLAGQVFWSPDSSSIGFVADGKLKKVSISGGPPQTLTDVLDSVRGTWGQQGVILIAPGNGTPIRRLPEAGGVSVAVTAPVAGESHFTPSFLPDGRHFLYWVSGKGVYLSSLQEGAQPVRLLPDNSPARFAPSDADGKRGHLLFVRQGNLMAQPFDSETLRVTGESSLLPNPSPNSRYLRTEHWPTYRGLL